MHHAKQRKEHTPMGYRSKTLAVQGTVSLVTEWFSKLRKGKLVFVCEEPSRKRRKGHTPPRPRYRIYRALCANTRCGCWLNATSVTRRGSARVTVCSSCGREYPAGKARRGVEVK
jgi:hypothetical protein